MKIVIACAGSKQGNYFAAADGTKVNFVAQPRTDQIEFRPDDPSDRPGKTWRDCLEDYNASYIVERNPFWVIGGIQTIFAETPLEQYLSTVS